MNLNHEQRESVDFFIEDWKFFYKNVRLNNINDLCKKDYLYWTVDKVVYIWDTIHICAYPLFVLLAPEWITLLKTMQYINCGKYCAVINIVYNNIATSNYTKQIY